jgi:membrane-bound metal-dependent hydrolase YbcI (DUF457 family)
MPFTPFHFGPGGLVAAAVPRRVGLLATAPFAAGALLGGWSHILLDGVMHPDVRPWAPWSDANGLFGIVPLGVLHVACVAAGAAAVIVWIGGARRVGPLPPEPGGAS